MTPTTIKFSSGEKYWVLIASFLGTVKDYFIAIGINFKGNYQFPTKDFFWASSSNYAFAKLPDMLDQHKGDIDAISTPFTGEHDLILKENENKPATHKNKGILPRTSSPSAHSIVKNRPSTLPARMMAVMGSIFPSIICSGLNGETNNCSTVPRSFSLASAAAGNSNENKRMF